MSKTTSKRSRGPLPHFVVMIGLAALIFLVAAGWVWGGGWIAQRGFHDFAGGAVIHLPVGMCALMASLMIGPRASRRWGSPPRPRIVRLVLSSLLVTAVGLLAYDPAAAFKTLSTGGVAVSVLVNAVVASLSGAFAVGLLNALFTGEWGRDATVKGVLVGLAGIAAGSAWVNPLGAAVIGSAAGIAARLTMSAFEIFHIDDRLDTFAIHGVGGALGTLAVALFLTGIPAESGLLMGGTPSILFDQFIGVVAIALGSGVTATAVLLLLDAGGLLRYSSGAIARQAARAAYEATMAEDGGYPRP